MLIASCNEFYGNGRLAGRSEIKLYPAPVVVAEGKSLIVGKRDTRNLGFALGAGQDVVPSYADCRSSPEAKIAYKKLA